jgi:hypothetical protein
VVAFDRDLTRVFPGVSATPLEASRELPSPIYWLTLERQAEP